MPHALALSLALHAAVLSAPPVRPAAGGAAVPLQAYLRVPPEALRPSAAGEPVPVAPARTERPPAVPPSPALARAAAEIAAPAEMPAPAAPVPAASGARAESLAPGAPPTGAAQAVSAAPPSAPVPAGAAGPDPDGVRSYRVALAREARRFKRYPREAQAAGWSGTAEVRLDVGDGGTARAPSLARSSGREALDGAALAMIAAAAQATAVPAALRGKAFSVVLPVSFELDD